MGLNYLSEPFGEDMKQDLKNLKLAAEGKLDQSENNDSDHSHEDQERLYVLVETALILFIILILVAMCYLCCAIYQ